MLLRFFCLQVEWLLKAICLIDLTTLAGDDTPVNVQRLCVKAVHPLSECVLNKIENAFNMNLQDLSNNLFYIV